MNPNLDPVNFLRQTPPFDALSPLGFDRAARALEITFLPAGTKILARDGEASRHLSLIRKGLIRFTHEGQTVMTLEEGELFGFVSILTGKPPYDVVVDEDLLAYRIPEDVFRDLLGEPAFSKHFTLSLAARLQNAFHQPPSSLLGVDLFQPISTLLGRPPVFVGVDATVGEATRIMREAGTSSVLVAAEPPGILTDRDLRNRVLAQDRGAETPVREVASFPVVTISAETPIYVAWQELLTHGLHHLPVARGGEIVGVITDTDLLRHQALGPVAVLKRVERLPGRDSLPGYAREIARMVKTLVDGGLDVPPVGRLVALANDALAKRILRWAEQGLGSPPCPYAWIVFGSEGRMEQTLLTDQDNALVWRDRTPEAAEYFARLAERVVEDLVAAGFPRCAGDFMATKWRGDLAEWEERFASWLTEPTSDAIIASANFFDFRAVHGELDLFPLERLILTARDRDPFRAALVNASLQFRPPIGAFGRLRGEAGGIDVKRHGLTPIVGLARIFALEAGSSARGTLDRLAIAAGAGRVSEGGAEELAEAFRFLLRLRLREQLRELDLGQTPGDRIVAGSLSSLERARLKEAFRAIEDAQQAAAFRYRTDRY